MKSFTFLIVFLLLVPAAHAQNYWRSINGEADSIARVAHTSRQVDRVERSFMVDTVVTPASIVAIPGSIAMSERGSVFIGGYAGVYRFTSRYHSPTVVLNQRAERLCVFGGTVIAATDSGMYMTSDDGGTWSKSAFFGQRMLHFITTDGLFLYASTDSELYRSLDTGASWQALILPTLRQNIYFLGGACGILVCRIGGYEFESRDGGISFSRIVAAEISDVVCDDSSVYAFTSSFRVFVAHDSEFVLLDTNYAVSLATYDADHHTLIGLMDPSVRRSRDRARTWQDLVSNYDGRVRAVVSRPGQPVWVSREHTAIVSVDGGDTWSVAGDILRIDSIPHFDTIWKYDTTYTLDTLRTHTLMTDRLVRGVCILNRSTLFCATDIGIVQSADKGLHWQLTNAGLRDSNLVAIGANGAEVYTASASLLYRSFDQGLHWDTVKLGWLSGAITSLTVGKSYLIVGTTAGLYRTADDGINWTGLSTAALQTKAIQGVTVAPWGTVYIYSNNAVARSRDDGSTFDLLTPISGPTMRNVATNAGLVAYGRELEAAAVSTDDGGTWTTVYRGDYVDRIGISPRGSILIQGNYFARLDSVRDPGRAYPDPWRGFFTDFAFDSSGGQYASLQKGGVLYHDDNQAIVPSTPNPTVRVYPNPSNGLLTIAPSDMAIESVTLLNPLGEEVYSALPIAQPGQQMHIDISNLPYGSYLLKISMAKGVEITKVIRK